MNDRDETTREIEALRERVSKLSAASLRIGAKLDPLAPIEDPLHSKWSLIVGVLAEPSKPTGGLRCESGTPPPGSRRSALEPIPLIAASMTTGLASLITDAWGA